MPEVGEAETVADTPTDAPPVSEPWLGPAAEAPADTEPEPASTPAAALTTGVETDTVAPVPAGAGALGALGAGVDPAPEAGTGAEP